MDKRYFSDKIVEWYHQNRRPLPWRETTDPYRIWLSEVILQQTRVAQGLPYYNQFVTAFPTISHLAEANEQQVLRLWQGLGYYTRARNLHKCARTIVATNNGKFPATFQELQALPGIGHYTAAAIASFAYGLPVAVVDGNVFRILSRIFGIDTPINSQEGKKRFTELANSLISKADPATHNQAVMEFGATFCTPQTPRCGECPFKRTCVARTRDLINLLPVKTPAKKSRKRYFFYFVVEKNKTLLMKKRESKDIWHGLFDFLLVERNRPVKPENLMAEPEVKGWFQKTDQLSVSKRYVHTLTHQVIHCRFIHLRANSSFSMPEKGLSFYSPHEIAQLPKPALISRFLGDQNHL